MRILAVDCTFNPYGGSYNYTKAFLDSIELYDFDKVIIFTTKKNLLLFKNVENSKIFFKVSRISSLSNIFRMIWVQLCLPCLLYWHRSTVLFSLGNYSPIVCFTKKVHVIHTIGPFEKSFYKNFKFHEKLQLFVNKILIVASSLSCQKIIFFSEYTKNLFIHSFPIKPNQCEVIKLGKDPFFQPMSNELPNAFNAKQRFILNVSHVYPYKNLETFIDAFKYIADKDIELVIAGKLISNHYRDFLLSKLESLGLEKRVKFIGEQSKHQLRLLYSSCTVFVFTSPFENYPHILNEAMACGAPIISANSTSMPEACDEAALYFNPFSPKDLATKIDNILSNDDLRSILIKQSLKQAENIESESDIQKKTSMLINNISSI